MPKVFISYSRDDRGRKDFVRNYLKGKDVSVWVDTDSIEHIWRDDAERGVLSSEVVVLIMSPSAKNSENVKRELSIAERAGRKIIPLLFEGDNNTAVPFVCEGIDYIDLTANPDENIDGIIKKLQENGVKFLIEHYDPFLNDGHYRSFKKLIQMKSSRRLLVLCGPDMEQSIASDIRRQIGIDVQDRQGNEDFNLQLLVEKDLLQYSFVFIGYNEVPRMILRIAETHAEQNEKNLIFEEKNSLEVCRHIAILPADSGISNEQEDFDEALNKIGVFPIRFRNDRQFPKFGESKLDTNLDKNARPSG